MSGEPKAEKSFLSELRMQFERQIDLRKNLDTKANSMITLATTIITINLAIAGFLVSRITDNFIVYYTSIGIFSLVVYFAINAIWKLVKVYEIKQYDYPIGYDYFFNGNEFDESMIQGVKNISESQYNDRMFKGYLNGIRSHEILNIEKVDGINEGQLWITRSLVTIGILIGFILVFGFDQFMEITKFVNILT